MAYIYISDVSHMTFTFSCKLILVNISTCYYFHIYTRKLAMCAKSWWHDMTCLECNTGLMLILSPMLTVLSKCSYGTYKLFYILNLHLYSVFENKIKWLWEYLMVQKSFYSDCMTRLMFEEAAMLLSSGCFLLLRVLAVYGWRAIYWSDRKMCDLNLFWE